MKNHWALISGSSRGLGKEIAEKLAAKGYNLILVARDSAKLEETTTEINNKYNIKIQSYSCDLSIKKEVEHLLKQITHSVDTLDLLVNNAGHYLPGTVAQGEDTLESQLGSNLYTAYYLTRAALPLLHKADQALIVNICSVAGLQAYPDGGNYSVSKFAMRGFSLNLQKELQATNIKVSTIYPGAFYSDSWADSDIPASRMMSVDDVAQVVTSLSDISNYSNIEEIILRPKNGDI